jgi:hypothetical protein
VFVGDSRANNFDTCSQPQNLNIHYISQRGDTIDILTDLTCSFLYVYYLILLVEHKEIVYYSEAQTNLQREWSQNTQVLMELFVL